jgi:uracil-DNA glycosylase
VSGLHPVEHLFARLEEKFTSYPPGVVRVPKVIPGTAFFPGGYGLWGTEAGEPLPPLPKGGVMVLGHNFDSEAGFANSLKNGGENLKGATWRPLLLLLELVGIPKERCFFTNFYMGLIQGSNPLGEFPGARDADFIRRCQRFLALQMSIVQPKLILTLGKEILKAVAALSPDLKSWAAAESLGMLDQHNNALVYPSIFAGVPHAVAVVALTHPALRHLNIGRRRYKTFVGNVAEQAMLKDALDKIGMLTQWEKP